VSVRERERESERARETGGEPEISIDIYKNVGRQPLTRLVQNLWKSETQHSRADIQKRKATNECW
jgi:hypothetical protein